MFETQMLQSTPVEAGSYLGGSFEVKSNKGSNEARG